MSGPRSFPGLTFRQDFFDDPAGWRAIGDLLMAVFDLDIGPIGRLGGHDRSNMPSAYFDAQGRCVANLSAFAMPVVVDGRPVRAAAWQSGAVLPDHRGRGLFRELMRVTLQRCEAAGFETMFLYTDKPTLYEPYGFVALDEHRFEGPAPEIEPPANSARRLSIDIPADLALLHDMLAIREPVSRTFAVTNQSLMFLFNAWLVDDVSLSFLPEQQAVVAWRQPESDVFELLDVVAPSIPSMTTILAGLGKAPQRVVVDFPPDRLDWRGVPVASGRDLVLMMRAAQHLRLPGPFRLSPMADF